MSFIEDIQPIVDDAKQNNNKLSTYEISNLAYELLKKAQVRSAIADFVTPKGKVDIFEWAVIETWMEKRIKESGKELESGNYPPALATIIEAVANFILSASEEEKTLVESMVSMFSRAFLEEYEDVSEITEKALVDFYAEHVNFFENNDIAGLFVFNQIASEVRKKQDN